MECLQSVDLVVSAWAIVRIVQEVCHTASWSVTITVETKVVWSVTLVSRGMPGIFVSFHDVELRAEGAIYFVGIAVPVVLVVEGAI